MLVLLPPSEGKTRPTSGPALDLESLNFPRLSAVRAQLLRTLIRISSGNPKRAAETLGLGPTQADALDVNAALAEEPTARADEVYTGVLFSALDLPSLDDASRERADRTLAVASGLFGLLRPSDHIPAYRMSGSVSLPRLGPVAARWRPVVPRAIAEAADGGLVIDLRSGMYTALGKAPAEHTATMRVLHEHQGQRKVVSHFNKATKGRLVRDLLQAGAEPADVGQLKSALADLGWTVEREGSHLDVVVAEL